MDLLKPFRDFFSAHRLPPGKPVLLAVSGGVDSVVLCTLCRLSGIPFIIAHANFSLRGAESERDGAFVRSLGLELGVEVVVKKWDTQKIADDRKISIQEAARSLRYEWFAEVVKERSCACTFTAHHADDNIETVLMNFFRGTGLNGLTGIPPSAEGLMRPMLDMRRKDILAFASAYSLHWVEDSSNLSSKYTRNYFRNELIPSIKNVYPSVENNILDNISRFNRIRRFYLSAMEQARKELLVKGPGDLRIPIWKLRKYDVPLVLFELLREHGFSEKQLPEALKLLDSSSGKFIESNEYRLIRHRDWLIIAPSARESELIVITKETHKVSFDGHLLEWEEKKAAGGQPDPSPLTAQLDARDISFPLVLRRWKEGDYFYPLGMRKKKKLSRFLMDLKLSKNEKENVWVLESDQRILWVAGHRIDDRFKLKESTRHMIVFTLKNHEYAGKASRHR